MSATTLHRFSELPGELRNAIWELGLPAARRLQIPLLMKRVDDANTIYPLPPKTIQDPAMLQVNRESRAIALQFYEYIPCKGRSGSYADFDFDDFFFNSEDFHDLYQPAPRWTSLAHPEEIFNISQADRRKIKGLVLGTSWAHSRTRPYAIFSRMLSDAFCSCLLIFECLKVIKIEIWQDDLLAHITTDQQSDMTGFIIRLLRGRLEQVMESISLVKASNRPAWEPPTLRIQVERADGQLYEG